MKVLVACEFSGRVREAFRGRGHDAWSCDIIPNEDDSAHHIQGDVLELIYGDADWDWDMMIAFPPCTHLAVSGARWFRDKQGEQAEALEFVQLLLDAPIPRIALENPIGVISTHIRKPDQIIQPWMFGQPERKTTCLWLKNLLKLVPTDDVKAEMLALPKNKQNPLYYLGPSEDRRKKRSITYQGIADAMADQWGT